MLDRLSAEAAVRFDLGEQATPLVEHLLAMITDRDHGRIQGFLAAFREEGMDAQVDSWVAEGAGAELSGPEVESGLGPGLVEEIAQRFDLDARNVAAALGFLIPRALDALTPGGEVPGDELLLARVEALRAGADTGPGAAGEPAPDGASTTVMSGATRPAGRGATETPARGAAAAATGAATGVPRGAASTEARSATAPTVPAAAPAGARPDGRPRRLGVLGWLLPLLVLLALVWWLARQCAPESQSGVGDSRSAEHHVDPPPGPRAGDSRSAEHQVDPPPGPRAGDSRSAEHRVDPPPGPRAGDPAASRLAGRRSLGSTVSGSEPADDAESPTTAPPPDPAASVAAARREGLDALAALDPDFTTEELVTALNHGRIDFAPSSAAISAAARGLLEEAATAILALPSGTRLEIGGHTDSLGEPQRNQRLSLARAEAVRNVLVDLGVPPAMLVPRGYGASRPVAGNDSAEGRIRNRRIEFAVVE